MTVLINDIPSLLFLLLLLLIIGVWQRMVGKMQGVEIMLKHVPKSFEPSEPTIEFKPVGLPGVCPVCEDPECPNIPFMHSNITR